MRVLILTSCTGEKRFQPENQLTAADFRGRSIGSFAKRTEELSPYRLPAVEMYTGQQHVRLLRGLQSLKEACPDISFDLKILSAGYGLLDESTPIVPYEMTFQGMKSGVIHEWAEFLKIPTEVQATLAEYDLNLILLGKEYLQAISFPPSWNSNRTIIFLAGKGSFKHLPSGPSVHVITLANTDAKRLGAGLVALKGRTVELLGEHVRQVGANFIKELIQQPATLEDFLGNYVKQQQPCQQPKVHPAKPSQPPSETPLSSIPPSPSIPSPIILIPDSWWNKTHRQKMRYFIPEWDDLVDPHYHFATDSHPPGAGDNYEYAVYSHQIYDEPQYDGILISKVIVESSKRKKEVLERLGVHRYLRVPRQFPIMGDCGAFGYLMEEVPPYETSEILDYYQNLDFDLGVSIDHLIVNGVLRKTLHYLVPQGGEKREISEEEYQKLSNSGEAREVKTLNGQINFLDSRPALFKKEILDEAEQWRRYELTINNARDFIEQHRRGGYRFTPIGAAQGWSPESYANCVLEYQKMGYIYIALGGLVRTNTKGILQVLEAVQTILAPGVKLHLFGVARPEALLEMNRLGVCSIDSASFLRRAWLGASSNYFTPETKYAAIRIPQSDKSPRAKRIVREGKSTLEEVTILEKKCLDLLRAYDKGQADLEVVLDVVMEYDDLMGENRKGFVDLFRKTLEDRPWQQCPCTICREVGVEVIIFRGNNRNRRRGFHNTKVFYDYFCQTLGTC